MDELTRREYRHTTHVEAVAAGRTVLAHHARDRDERCDVYSVTKSVLSTLVGIACDAGALALDHRVAPLLPGLPLDPALTVRNLLTMTAGLSSEIDDVMELPGGWLEAIAAAPARAPGRFAYDNGTAHVLAAALAAAVGEPLPRYADRVLFGPLGIEAEWPLDPDGLAYGFGHLRLRTRDLLALGDLYLRRGGRLVSEAYVAEATRAQTPGGPPEGDAYGFLWWVSGNGFYAGGWAGQALVVVPRLELVVVTIGDAALLADGWRPARGLAVERAVALVSRSQT